MSYVRVESSVRTNRKFLLAGPAASWLWLCGLAYCQDTLTDGYIPPEALEFLGVKGTGKHSPNRLAMALVLAGLWEADERGGWRIHDYLDYNRSADTIKDIKDKKRDAGARGGKASGEARSKHSASALGNEVLQHSVNPIRTVAAADAASVAAPLERGPGKTIGPRDVWFRLLTGAYPGHRVTTGHMTESAFNQQFVEDPRDDAVIWGAMLAGLENQQAGHEWRVKGMVPKLEKWLRDGLWRQRHEESPPEVLVNERTAATLAAAASILKGRAS